MNTTDHWFNEDTKIMDENRLTVAYAIVAADARLIAAAPDLLAALEALRDYFDEDEGPRGIMARRMTEAAINKAKGE